MALTPGIRIGPYEIGGPIGAGGMGEVYRATDTRLGRDVAIKVLPEAVADDPERLARFEREARALAALSHPNVATIHGLEQAGNTHAIVMELVEGPTLADRIARGALPVSDALRIARQIADALEAAHEKGIIHRDLKPANVKCPHGGMVRVLDFGLAKMVADAANDEPDASTTIATATRTGVVLGTSAYMSPEQARGEPVDKRTDIWAFGCVLYEMLTGRSTFARSSVNETVAAVLERDPDWSLLPATIPTPLQRLLRRCLEKDPKRRLRDIGDAGTEIDELLSAATTPQPGTGTAERASHVRSWRGAAAAAAVIVLAGGVWFVWNGRTGRQAATAPELRLEITTPATSSPESLAVSPDSLTIAFAANTPANRRTLWLRELSSGVVRSLAGTDDATEPFWSPDGRSIGFFAEGKLKRIDVAGGAAQVLADAPDPRGGTWTADGRILFTPTQIAPIYRVPAAGGEPVQLTHLAAGELAHLFPRVLPGTDRLMYFSNGEQSIRGVYIAGLDGSGGRQILPELGPAMEGPPGYLLFVRNGTLMAQRLDAAGAALTGDPVRVADNVLPTVVPAGPPMSAASGALAFRTQSTQGDRQLIWLDRAGRELGRLLQPVPGLQSPALSPDGRTLALNREVDGNRDVWLLDLPRNVLTRFTSDSAADSNARWAPDGNRLFFSSNRTGVLGIYEKALAGGPENPVVVTRQNSAINDVSADGSRIVYLVANPKSLLDIWTLPLAPGSQPMPLVESPREDVNGVVAPNGKWLAHQSSESGRYEVSLRTLAAGGRPVQVSTDGGTQPHWRGDGRELFYLDLQGTMTAAAVTFGRDAQSVEVGPPRPLFKTRIGGANILQNEYIVSSDGQRFLLDTPFESSSPISVILNWRPPESNR